MLLVKKKEESSEPTIYCNHRFKPITVISGFSFSGIHRRYLSLERQDYDQQIANKIPRPDQKIHTGEENVSLTTQCCDAVGDSHCPHQLLIMNV